MITLLFGAHYMRRVLAVILGFGMVAYFVAYALFRILSGGLG